MARSSSPTEELHKPVAQDPQESEDLLELAKYVRKKGRQATYLVAPDGSRLKLPASVFKVLSTVVTEMAQGNAISVVPVHHELTTQEAANLLNISRPHLVKLLETGEIPFHKTGSHRKVRFDDLMDYRKRRSARRRQLLRELSEEDAKLGI